MKIQQLKPGRLARFKGIEGSYSDILDLRPYVDQLFLVVRNGGQPPRSAVHIATGEHFTFIAEIGEWEPYEVSFGDDFNSTTVGAVGDLLALLLTVPQETPVFCGHGLDPLTVQRKEAGRHSIIPHRLVFCDDPDFISKRVLKGDGTPWGVP